MICLILGYDDHMAYGPIFGFLHKIFHSTRFNYVAFISNQIHDYVAMLHSFQIKSMNSWYSLKRKNSLDFNHILSICFV